MNCLGFCGCIGSAAWEIEDKQVESCKDPTGLFQTDDPIKYRTCDWLNTNVKKKLNCGLTEIGLACICQCPAQGHSSSQNVLIQDVAWVRLVFVCFAWLSQTSTLTFLNIHVGF